MTVEELIEKLKTFDPDLRVFMWNHYGDQESLLEGAEAVGSALKDGVEKVILIE